MRGRVLTVLGGILLSALTFGQDITFSKYRPDPETIQKVLLPPSRFGKLFIDLFEYNVNSDEKEIAYDTEFWYGGDFNRLWIETEGEHSLEEGSGSVERFNLYYARLVSPFWDFRIGLGTQAIYGDGSESRNYAVVGFQGLAPYWFEVDVNISVDTEGKATADLEVEYDLLFTQRLILQPRFETLVAFSDINDMGIGSGLNNVELGLRLRYEIRREFAPYVGVSWTKYFGKTRDLIKAIGDETEKTNLLIGLRMWF